MVRLQIFTFLFACFIIQVGQAQSVITGVIVNRKGQLLSGATVTISKDSTASILAYGISDSEGNFRIKTSSDSEMIFIKVAYLGYTPWTRNIKNQNEELEVVLKESSEELKEVMVEARIIRQRGDTLSFRVSAFQDQKDRVIADVLKKMPGVEIMPGGQIHYQGQPIQKYYIEGLDLLEGRYSLANNNISADDVSEVQILENHQPVRVLDSLEFSERASLNIKLKKEVTVSGTAEVGAGFSPLLWKAKITPMIFTKKQQAIITYQTNNIGSDVSREIRDFSFSELGKEFSIGKRDWLSIREISPPPFEQERWLDNNVHLGSLNYLVRLKKNIDLKMNISYLNDFQEQIGNIRTRIFTPTDTIDLVENVHNELFTNTLQSGFILERNTADNYLKNELEINRYWDSGRGNILSPDSRIQQRLYNPFSVVRNKLRILKPLGRQLVTFRSSSGYTEANQSLNVAPGQFPELLNDGESYAETMQRVSSSTFFTDNSAGFTKALKDFTIAPEVGISIRKQQLDSRLTVFSDDTITYPDGNFINGFHFLSYQGYITSKLHYDKSNWHIRLTTPMNFRSFEIKDNHVSDVRELTRLTFEPNLFVKKKISAYLESSISANLSNDFRDFRSMYSGFILNNYRSILRYNSAFPESFSQTYNGRLSYRNPLNSLFASTSYTYVATESNLLYSNFVGEGGAILLEAIERENTSTSHNYSLEGSKYFIKINTTLKFGSSYSILQREQLLNNSLAEVNSQHLTFRLGLKSEVAKWLSTSYNGNLSYLLGSVADMDFDQISIQQHLLDLSFFPADNQYFGVKYEYYYNNISLNNKKSYFLNLDYRYTFKEKNVDLSVTWNNVFGTEEFVRVSSSEFSVVHNTYQLRPSQLIASLRFTL